MKIKLILFIVIISTLFYLYRHTKFDLDVKPDIVIGPGGYNGFYQLGICHYIKNHFNYSDKKIYGFSAGSWAGLFLCLKKHKTNECIRKIFKNIKYTSTLPQISNSIKLSLAEFKDDDFNLSNLYVCMTQFNNNNLYVKNDFLSLNDCVNSCGASSFVPFITYNELFYFYNHKLVVDGGMCYNKCIKTIDTKKTLMITRYLFKKKPHFKAFLGFKKPKMNLYDLYLLGYRNAQKNHDELKKYFHSDSF